MHVSLRLATAGAGSTATSEQLEARLPKEHVKYSKQGGKYKFMLDGTKRTDTILKVRTRPADVIKSPVCPHAVDSLHEVSLTMIACMLMRAEMTAVSACKHFRVPECGRD